MKPMERDLPHLRSSGRREFPVAGRDGTVDWHLARSNRRRGDPTAACRSTRISAGTLAARGR